LLQTVKSKEEGKVDSVNKQTIQPMEEKVVKPRPPKYNRYGQESFGKEATGEFSIVTTGSYHGMTLETMTEVASKPIAETPLPKSKIIPEVKDTIVDVPLSRKKSQSRTPIIIVPSAPSSIITIYNCREFLEEFKYVPSEEKKKGGMKRSSDITIYRKKPHPSYPGQTISKPFKVTDNPLRLNRQEWEQVVAVFVAGPTWQFKGWPDMVAGGSPVDIFTKSNDTRNERGKD
jgi:parafibromin